jgi:hypothetical protein
MIGSSISIDCISRLCVADLLSHEIAIIDDVIDDLVLIIEPTLASAQMIRSMLIIRDFFKRIV